MLVTSWEGNHSEHDIAYQKLAIVTEALNGGQKLNVCDANVKRWYPWFKPNGSPSSFAFDVSSYDTAYADAGSGSRLCLKHANLRNIRQNNLLTFGKTSR